ncbi:hypothetical protein Dimus_006727 [Dionaea muscipula]
MAAGVELKDSERIGGGGGGHGGGGDGEGIAMSFPANDSSASSSPPKLPRRLRRRLLLSEASRSPSTAEKIDAKLRDADLRRQQFYEYLSSKARPKPRSPTWSSSPQEEELSQRIEARLSAAEQKRLDILAKAQMRLARLDELRQAAKSGVELRFERERDQLGVKVESRVQQAEANRLHILKIHRQLRAARKERTAQSLMRKMVQESKYKECVQTAIHQKRAAAERKRLGLLEAERSKARARLLRVQRAANSVYTQREIERMKKKDLLEDRLQRAKRQRAEYIRQKKRSHDSPRPSMKYSHKQAELLARTLARCWRQFVKCKGTTYSLAKAYEALDINEKSVATMPFEQLALLIESDTTILSIKSLLSRFETRLTVKQASHDSSLTGLENIDHLLKRVASPKRRGTTNHPSRSSATKKLAPIEKKTNSKYSISRYPARVVLCAYMILGHPDAVLNGKGEHENVIKSAVKFIRELELLINIVLEGNNIAVHRGNSFLLDHPVTFRSQLEAFDKAWCSYLYHFVVWKIKDAKMLEEDLVRAACQLELSMMRTCKLTPEGDQGDLTHDMKAVQKQVMEDQKLLKEKVHNLSGDAGVERMEYALSDARAKFFAAKEYFSPSTSPSAHIASPSLSGSENGSPVSISDSVSNQTFESGKLSRVARSLFKEHDPHASKDDSPSTSGEDGQRNIGSVMITENELLVNDIVHGVPKGFSNSLGNEDHGRLKEKVKETMEKAFWDGIMNSVNGQQPDFSWVLKLITEVRDELCEMSPSNWRQDIVDAIDLDIVTQVLATGTLDVIYLGKVLAFVLVTLQKLSAPANEEEMKAEHQTLLKELAEISQSSNSSSFARTLIKGLRYVLQKIQILKREISKARIEFMEPLIKGPAGFDYLRNAFSSHFGSPIVAASSLPLTSKWLSSTKTDSEEEWREYMDSMSSLEHHPHGLPPVTLRTGGSVSGIPVHSAVSVKSGKEEEAGCKGEKTDLLIRLGLLKLVSQIEGLTPETLPESMKLNLSRLRAVQSQVQNITVISTSMLVLRQALVSEKLVASASDLENIVSQSTKQLSELVEGDADIGLSEIVEAIIELPDISNLVVSLEKLRARKEVVATMIAKSLKAGDAIFTHVSRAIYSAMRGAVLGGTGSKGRQLVEMALRQIGAILLTEKVMDAAQSLIVMATVSGRVHGAWYDSLLKNV